MPPARIFGTGLVAAALTVISPQANAFFCLMMNALSNSGGGYHVSIGSRAQPRVGAGPITYAGPGFVTPSQYASGFPPFPPPPASVAYPWTPRAFPALPFAHAPYGAHPVPPSATDPSPRADAAPPAAPAPAAEPTAHE